MKKDLNKILCFIVLLIIWLHPAISNFGLDEAVSVVLTTAVFAASRFLKKDAAAAAVVFGSSIILSIYKFELLPTYLPSWMLIFAHRYSAAAFSGEKKDKAEISGVYVTLSYLASVLNFIYSFIREGNPEGFRFSLKSSLTINTGWLLCAFVFLMVSSFGSESVKKEKVKLTALRRIYFSAVFGILISFFSYTQTSQIYDMPEVRIAFMPWFVFMVGMCFNEDPVMKEAITKTEKILMK